MLLACNSNNTGLLSVMNVKHVAMAYTTTCYLLQKVGQDPLVDLPFVDATCNPFHRETCCPQSVFIATCNAVQQHVALTTLY